MPSISKPRAGLPLLWAAAASLLLLAGCSRVNPDNYNKIESGMTRDQVYDILGKPDDVSGSGLGGLTLSSETWNGTQHRIEVTFIGDKLATRSIEDAAAED